MRAVTSVLILLALFLVASGRVDLQCSCYNSDGSAFEAVSGEGMAFQGVTELDPASLFIKSSGGSTGSYGDYFYQLGLREDILGSSADARSGSFSWQGAAKDGQVSVDSQAATAGGALRLSYASPGFKLREKVEALGSVFSETVSIRPDILTSRGWGSTLPGGEGKGFCHAMYADGGSRQTEVDARAYGDISATWGSGAVSKPGKFGLALEMTGSGRLSELPEMTCWASGLPLQRLPPGNLSVSRKSIEDLELPDVSVPDELREFRDDYSGSPSEALWYLMDQRSSIEPREQQPGGNYSDLGDRFKMRMGISLTK